MIRALFQGIGGGKNNALDSGMDFTDFFCGRNGKASPRICQDLKDSWTCALATNGLESCER